MTIEELAAELGKKIKEDARIEAMNKARDEYETNEQLHAYMNEYSAQQEAIQAEAAKETPDSLLIAKMQGRVDELYKLIINNPVLCREFCCCSATDTAHDPALFDQHTIHTSSGQIPGTQKARQTTTYDQHICVHIRIQLCKAGHLYICAPN
mgnify:CR=1 FL=1